MIGKEVIANGKQLADAIKREWGVSVNDTRDGLQNQMFFIDFCRAQKKKARYMITPDVIETVFDKLYKTITLK